jgi:hypothetical protein
MRATLPNLPQKLLLTARFKAWWLKAPMLQRLSLTKKDLPRMETDNKLQIREIELIKLFPNMVTEEKTSHLCMLEDAIHHLRT